MEKFEKSVVFSFEQNLEILAINLKSKILPKKNLYENNAAVLISWNKKARMSPLKSHYFFLPDI